MKLFEQKEPTLRYSLRRKAAKRYSQKSIKKLRNKSFRMYLKQLNNNPSEKDFKKSYGTEF